MPRPLAHNILNALVAALALTAISCALAQTKPASMVGQTRDQIVTQLGEPKSNIKAGTREVLFFDHLKITMRNNVAIESEVVADDAPAPKRSGETAAAASAPAAQPAPAPAPVQPVAPAPLPSNMGPAAAQEAAALARPPPPPPESTPTQAPVKTAEAPLAIKFIKSGGGAKAAPRPASTTTAPAAARVETKKASPATTAAPTPPPTAPTVADTTILTPVVATVPTTSEKEKETATAAAETPSADDATAKPAVDPKKKAAVRQRWRLRRDSETEEDSVEIFSTQSYIIAAIGIAAGAAFLWWRRGQRDLALAATTVSHTPFEPAFTGPADTAGMFSAELVGKLGQKKFERLVASYYAKTGVVAERTNAAADAAVHIKIFWKGEAKPFAGVQCHANPPTLIGPLPMMKLFEALTAADIRRGYIVTTGKFNVEARDLAEEKHFTLLSGDIFLEKLNALPPAARGELLKETNTEEPASSAAASV